MAKKVKAKKKPAAKKKPVAKKKPAKVKASAKPAAKASVKVKEKPAKKEKVKKPRAPRTWKTFLNMVIIGAVLLTIAIVAVSYVEYILASYFDLSLIPEDMNIIILILVIVAAVTGAAGVGLLGPGLPIMIVKLRKEKKNNPKKPVQKK